MINRQGEIGGIPRTFATRADTSLAEQHWRLMSTIGGSLTTNHLGYNGVVGSRTGRSLPATGEESPNSAEQCAG